MIGPQPGTGRLDMQAACQFLYGLGGAAEEAPVAANTFPEGDARSQRNGVFA